MYQPEVDSNPNIYRETVKSVNQQIKCWWSRKNTPIFSTWCRFLDRTKDDNAKEIRIRKIKTKTNTLITTQRYKFSHRLITISALILHSGRAGCRWIFISHKPEMCGWKCKSQTTQWNIQQRRFRALLSKFLLHWKLLKARKFQWMDWIHYTHTHMDSWHEQRI